MWLAKFHTHTKQQQNSSSLYVIFTLLDSERQKITADSYKNWETERQ